MEFTLDNQIFTIDSKYESDDFVWNKLSTMYLSSGKHTLRIKNIDGVNVINVISVIGQKDFEEFKNILKHDINENK